MKRILVLIFVLNAFFANAQRIENVKAHQQEKKIIINYDITDARSSETFTVSVYCSTDAGKSFGKALAYVSKDVGQGISGGKGKTIVWDVLSERDALASETVVFEVRAKIADSETVISSSDNSFADPRDGKTYKTVSIGGQIWMAENLNFETESGSWCYYSEKNNCDVYGRLYTWEVAKRVCPSGWHLPSTNEWDVLIEQVGGLRKAGAMLKSSGILLWEKPNSGTENKYGFSALPGGNRIFYNKSYEEQGKKGFFWTTRPRGTSKAVAVYFSNHYERVFKDDFFKSTGLSVRCIKD